MATVSQIRERLIGVFSETQADVLAHVVVESRDHLVTGADFHALTDVVRELAESQKELADAQKRTESRMEELADAQKELTWAMKDTRKQLGGLAQSVGYGLEAYAMDRIPKILSRHMPFVEEASGPEQFISATGGQDEVDVVVRGTLSGKPVVFLCETKTKISPQEIRDFLVTVNRVRPQIACDDVRVLYFAYRASPEARAAVAEVGGYLTFPHTILVRPPEAA